jgi:hypothetical protein
MDKITFLCYNASHVAIVRCFQTGSNPLTDPNIPKEKEKTMSDSVLCPHCSQEVVVSKANSIPPLYYVSAADVKWNHLSIYHTGCEQSYLRIFEAQAVSLATDLGIKPTPFGTPNETIVRARASWEASNRKCFDEASVAALVKEFEEMTLEDFAGDEALASIFAEVRGENGSK